MVRQVNQLDHLVVTHNHGHVVEAASDGHPTDFIQPGESREYRYPNDQPAGTFWLHDHIMDRTELNIYRGLSMFYILHDDVWDRLGLPSGEYDVPLLIQDRAFNEDNSLFVSLSMVPKPCPQGAQCDAQTYGAPFHDKVVVNGVFVPRFEVAARKYLFRVLNGSSHRTFRLHIQRVNSDIGNDGILTSFKTVASDGGLIPFPVEHDNLLLAPAERFAFVVDFSQYPVGSSFAMRSYGRDSIESARTVDHIMRFDVTRTAPDTSVVPDKLTTIVPLREEDAVVRRTVNFQRGEAYDLNRGATWLLNQKYFDPARIDFRGKLNTTEVWDLVNQTSQEHTFHSHLSNFQVLSWSGTIPPEYRGWKDTVFIRSFQNVRIIIRWQRFPGIYVFHCHHLGHEDLSMMGQIEISE